MPRERCRFRFLCPLRAGVDTRPAWLGVDFKWLARTLGHENVNHVARVARGGFFGFLRRVRLLKHAPRGRGVDSKRLPTASRHDNVNRVDGAERVDYAPRALPVPVLVSPAGGLSKNFLDIYVHFCYNYHVDH